MTRSVAFIGLLVLGLVTQHVLHYGRYVRARREQRRAVQAWENEGGAVPPPR